MSRNKLSSGVELFDYGMGLTESNILVIYGGLSVPSFSNSENNLFNVHSDLWIVNVTEKCKEMALVDWSGSGGGFNRIISIGGEYLVIFGPIVKVKLIDIKNMQSFDIRVIGAPDNIERTAFGLAPVNNSRAIIFGGYNQAKGSIKILNSMYIFYDVSLYNDPNVMRETKDFGIIILVSLSGFIAFPSIFLSLFYYRRHRKHLRAKEVRKLKLAKELEIFNDAMEEVIKKAHLRVLDENDNTMTLVLPNYYGLCVPIYKKGIENQDFKVDSLLAQGGFGSVYKGTILNEKFAKLYNSGVPECAVKKSHSKTNTESFLQELSIHEIFKDIKYVAKLICYSENTSSCIVLRYYELGSLFQFIKVGVVAKIGLEYDFEVALYIAKQTAWIIKFLHSKHFVHNDIKPDNILLDSDRDEIIFPVLTDFGITSILKSADVVQGMKVSQIQAATRSYSAPEILNALKGKVEYCPTPKSDVYSFGMVIYELFTRRKPWPARFIDELVVRGIRPELNKEMILVYKINTKRNFHRLHMVSLIKQCWIQEKQLRPTMDVLYNYLCNTDTMKEIPEILCDKIC